MRALLYLALASSLSAECIDLACLQKDQLNETIKDDLDAIKENSLKLNSSDLDSKELKNLLESKFDAGINLDEQTPIKAVDLDAKNSVKSFSLDENKHINNFIDLDKPNPAKLKDAFKSENPRNLKDASLINNEQNPADLKDAFNSDETKASNKAFGLLDSQSNQTNPANLKDAFKSENPPKLKDASLTNNEQNPRNLKDVSLINNEQNPQDLKDAYSNEGAQIANNEQNPQNLKDASDEEVAEQERLAMQIDTGTKVALSAIAAALKEGDEARAYDLAKAACAKRCDSLALNFALIRTALGSGDYDEALAASDRVLIYDPQNITAHLAAAQIYKKQGNEALFDLEVAELEQLNLSPMQRSILEGLKSQKRHKLRGDISFGITYESNPQHQTSRDFLYRTPLGYLKIEADDIKSKAASNISASITLSSQLSKTLSNDLSFSSYNKYYLASRKQNYSNISVLSISDYLSAQIAKNFSIAAYLGYDYAILRSKAYSHTLSADLSFNYDINPSLSIGAGLSASWGGFVQLEDRADRYTHLAMYLQASKSFKDSYLYARAEFGNEKAPNSASISSDFNQQIFSMGYIKKLTDSWNAKASASFTHNAYKKFHGGFISKRDDKVYRGDLSATYRINEASSLVFGLGYTKQDSNQELYNYDNYSAYVMYKLKFD